MTPSAQPLPAATVALLRRGRGAGGSAEVLLIHRPASMAFGPGIHVFPGGKVDPEDVVAARSAAISDRELAAMGLGRNLEPVDALALHIAACREVVEEVNVRLDPGALVPIAHWTTPPFMPRRFSTWFFVADLPQGAEPVFSPEEVEAHRWVTPRDALEAMAAGEIAMWVPTTSVLERLLEIDARWAADVREQIHLRLVRGPRVEKTRRDGVHIVSDAAGGLPGRTCRSALLGRREIVVVDPGDPSDAAIDAIRRTAVDRKGRIRAVVLTRPDPDHAGGAEALAIPLEVPVLAAPGAGRHLPYEVRELADGDRLPTDVGVVVRLGGEGPGQLRLERG